MLPRYASVRFSSTIALLLVTLLLAMAPFAAALEIHHELAAADHDGHEHSDDTDLCQWVQYHTGHSLIGDVPVPCAFLAHAPPQLMPAPRARLPSPFPHPGLLAHLRNDNSAPPYVHHW